MATRALVLGSGGQVGIAWQAGLINGLADGGVNLGEADFILGTSAGACIGARLAMGHDPRGFAAPFLDTQAAAASAQRAPGPPGAPADLAPLLRLIARVQAGDRPPGEAMKALGQYALGARTPSEEEFLASFALLFRDLPEDAWPSRPYACTAIDAESGEFAFWTEQSKVGLKRAIASSCAVPGVYPCVTIHGRRYMDGALRSWINADMATGYDKVLVVVVRGNAPAPLSERLEARREAEFKTLREGGAEVQMIAPDEASTLAMGANLMDHRQRGPSAAAGLAQGKAQAAYWKAFWT